MSPNRRANQWRSDLLVIRENIAWMEKIGALQLSFGISILFTTVLQMIINTKPDGDKLRPIIHLCNMICAVCLIVCGFLIRGVRMWSTCGYIYACLLANCSCLAVLLPPLGFAHCAASLVTELSTRSLPLPLLGLNGTQEHHTVIRNFDFICFVDSYILLYFMSNIQLGFCIVMCSFQAHLCCLTVHFREQRLCYVTMFSKFGLGLFQWLGDFAK